MNVLRGLVNIAKPVCRILGVYKPACVFYDNLCRRYEYEMVYHQFMPLRIRFMVLSVGQACNYKCKNCGNFAPFAPAEFMRYKFEDITQSMNQILESVDNIRILQIQGGEPFLYSDLGRLVKHLRSLGGGV